MNKREIVQTLMDSIQKGDFENAGDLLANDFQFSGPVPEPIGKDMWLEMSINLKAAFPDLDYHFKVIGANGDVVKSTTQMSGTHKGPLDLIIFNMGVVPVTNKHVSAKMAKTKVTVKEGKITLWAAEPADGADLAAILRQLQVDL
jgi:predicted ester cyclase